ncbi:Uma2 family endonuclease [Aetokthonos hydrillicola Thurmond2011]|jgi:Uma2 family endonuclease|uniref:Uma2 family endonuclease n=1 Tax=Aetokthonos hydrillicola Thurmond2011 TaxID=2712845 RepID=A0AAP5I9F0_9CYAN|nr:Uma2 family endonuclease [Aetokthonos hydrillicola]MBO3458798.1 Uma2 family endonuclease [Aetokthonos hydrillicola CCALA 1050]MBW4585545.1 Uma2 family endonuclease [Aetokthonos hydrillicola CCALA 1050]MDR9896169.1 Uma2 family endonuclease [Aetokthonos hydrillicola Thurmond2011]
MTALTLQLPLALKFTDDEFEQLVAVNQELRLELTSSGELVIMSPTGGETGNRNFDLLGQIWLWNSQKNLGKAFDSSTGFKLPNGAIRSPDASWIKQERWDKLTLQQRKKYLPLCPDFAVELVSETDDMEDTRAKMREYIDNGLRLGWLINPKDKQVEIYRCNREVEVLNSPTSLSGEDVLAGFVLDLANVLG